MCQPELRSIFQGWAKLSGTCWIALFLSLAIVIFIHGCAPHKKYPVDPKWQGYTQRGKASFYAMKFQFRKTASGERFNNFSMSAAHRSLPFGTRVRVTNIRNKKHVTVRINDRGPYIKGRIIDLTRGAFARIEDTKRGVADVEIVVVP